MPLSEENKILLLILLVAVAFWFFSGKTSNKKKEPAQKKELVSNNFDDKIDTKDKKTNKNSEENEEHFESQSNVSANDSDPSLSQQSVDSMDSTSVSSQSNLVESNIQEQSTNVYKSVSYSKGNRGSKSNELDKFFEGNYPKNSDNNNGFSPMVNDDIGAAYTSGKPEKLTDKDKFNPDSLLPRERNSEWVDDPYEQVNVKSSSLANVFRPVGINSVQSTKKLASHDIRGVPKAPKLNVSPWNNSSVDGDTNMRNESLCL